MFNVTMPPLPSTEDLQSLRLDAKATQAAVKLRATISAQVFLLQPETLMMLARQAFPDENDFQAISEFGLNTTAALRVLARHGERVRNMAEAETKRLAPMVAEAARRSLAIPAKLEGVNNSLRLMESGIEARRNTLIKAGVTSDDLERVMAEGAEDQETRRTALNAERIALLHEQESLCRFLRSNDEKDLPKDFSIVEVPRISGHDAHRSLIGAAHTA